MEDKILKYKNGQISLDELLEYLYSNISDPNINKYVDSILEKLNQNLNEDDNIDTDNINNFTNLSPLEELTKIELIKSNLESELAKMKLDYINSIDINTDDETNVILDNTDDKKLKEYQTKIKNSQSKIDIINDRIQELVDNISNNNDIKLSKTEEELLNLKSDLLYKQKIYNKNIEAMFDKANNIIGDNKYSKNYFNKIITNIKLDYYKKLQKIDLPAKTNNNIKGFIKQNNNFNKKFNILKLTNKNDDDSLTNDIKNILKNEQK